MPPKKKKASASAIEDGTSAEEEEVRDKTIVCIDHVNGTPVIGKKHLKNGEFHPCANFSIEILRFANGINFSAPSFLTNVYITSGISPRKILIPDSVESKKQLTTTITTALSAPTYCKLDKNEFTSFYGGLIEAFVAKGLEMYWIISYTGIQGEKLDINDLPNTFFCVLSEDVVIGYDGNQIIDHPYIFSSDIVNKHNRKKDNKLSMLQPIQLQVTTVEESKKEFEKLFEAGPVGPGAESFKLLMVSYQAQLAAPVVKQVKTLDNSPLIALFGEHGAAKTTCNELMMHAYSDPKFQFNAATLPATLELLSTTTTFPFYLDDLNNKNKELAFTGPFYDEKGTATQTGGMSKPRAKLVWSTNEDGKRGRKLAGRAGIFRLLSWLQSLSPEERVLKLGLVQDLLQQTKRPLQFTLSMCQEAATPEFSRIYQEELKFVDENFPVGLDSREKNIWAQLLTWFQTYAVLWPHYFDRSRFNLHLKEVVIPDIYLWNPSAGPSCELDEFLCSGIENLMADPSSYYKVLRCIGLGKRGKVGVVNIARPAWTFPHLRGMNISAFDDVVKSMGGKTTGSQKFLRPDSIDTTLVVTESNPGYNAKSHRATEILLSSLEDDTVHKIEMALSGTEAWRKMKEQLSEETPMNEEDEFNQTVSSLADQFSEMGDLIEEETQKSLENQQDSEEDLDQMEMIPQKDQLDTKDIPEKLIPQENTVDPKNNTRESIPLKNKLKPKEGLKQLTPIQNQVEPKDGPAHLIPAQNEQDTEEDQNEFIPLDLENLEDKDGKKSISPASTGGKCQDEGEFGPQEVPKKKSSHRRSMSTSDSAKERKSRVGRKRSMTFDGTTKRKKAALTESTEPRRSTRNKK